MVVLKASTILKSNSKVKFIFIAISGILAGHCAVQEERDSMKSSLNIVGDAIYIAIYSSISRDE